MAQALKLRGYREFLRACDRAEKGTKKEVRTAFREVGQVVQQEWQGRFRPIDERSAAGLRVRVRQRGVAVEQSLRKTTGTRPDYGALQVRVGVQALEAKEDEVEHQMERALDRVADLFERKP